MVKKIVKTLRYINLKNSKTSRAPVSLRTLEDEIIYGKHKKNGKAGSLKDEEPMKNWLHWRLIKNKFPYNAVFKTHHMLIPIREVPKHHLSKSELEELDSILIECSETYDCMLVNFSKKQSIKNHYHIHLLMYKDNRKHLKF